MPDHLHFFAEPGEQPLPFDDWITVWKSGVTRILKKPQWRWQAGSFHHRIRSYEDYNEKRIYMDENPVTAGLVERIEDWPCQGEERCFSATIGGLECVTGTEQGGRAKPDPGRGHTHAAAQIRRG
jgi:hypothetical protein